MATVGQWAVDLAPDAPLASGIILGLVAAAKFLGATIPIGVAYGRLPLPRAEPPAERELRREQPGVRRVPVHPPGDGTGTGTFYETHTIPPSTSSRPTLLISS
ncbi:MAG: hypothetical protein WA966_02690 [Ornithinimicrobium sp.]